MDDSQTFPRYARDLAAGDCPPPEEVLRGLSGGARTEALVVLDAIHRRHGRRHFDPFAYTFSPARAAVARLEADLDGAGLTRRRLHRA